MNDRFILDHVGVMVHSLDKGEEAYRRLGFKLTPRSFHSGATRPGGPVEPWGSGNHCAMFRSGYLEIQGITDPSRYSSAKLTLSKYEGAHIVATGCGNAETAFAELKAGGAAVAPPILMQRQAAFGPNDEETRLAQFKLVYADREIYPEARFLTIEHLTHDVLWQPHLIDHPNGAQSLTETWLCIEDLGKSASRLSKLFGTEPERENNIHRYRLNGGSIFAVTPDRLESVLPGAKPPCVPYVAGFGVGVSNLDQTESVLRASGIAMTRSNGALVVGAPDTFGPSIRFHLHQETVP